jgi:hypothetical protein
MIYLFLPKNSLPFGEFGSHYHLPPSQKQNINESMVLFIEKKTQIEINILFIEKKKL